MNVEVNLNAEEINKQVSEAIVNSVLGSKLKKEIGEALGKILSTDYYGRGIIADLVSTEVKSAITAYLHEPENLAKIQAAVRKQMEAVATEEIISKAIEKLWRD